VVGVETQITKWGTPLVPGEFIMRHSPLKVFMDSWLGAAGAGQVTHPPPSLPLLIVNPMDLGVPN